MQTNTETPPNPGVHSLPSRRQRTAAMVGAGLLAGLIAAGIGGVASAQSGGTTVVSQVGSDGEVVLGSEDDAVWQQFDRCLTDAGIDFEALDASEGAGTWTEADEDRVEAAFESCESMLVDAGIEVNVELSPEDEAVFDEFDQCLTDAGVDFEALDAAFEAGTVAELDEDELDAAFESCEPIFENLSEEMQVLTEDFSVEDEVVVDEFDQCLTDAGLDAFAADGDLDDELDGEVFGFSFDEAEMDRIDAAFESCEPILDSLTGGFVIVDEYESDLDD